MTLVSSGLTPGDLLILTPLDRLDDGTACRARADDERGSGGRVGQ